MGVLIYCQSNNNPTKYIPDLKLEKIEIHLKHLKVFCKVLLDSKYAYACVFRIESTSKNTYILIITFCIEEQKIPFTNNIAKSKNKSNQMHRYHHKHSIETTTTTTTKKVLVLRLKTVSRVISKYLCMHTSLMNN